MFCTPKIARDLIKDVILPMKYEFTPPRVVVVPDTPPRLIPPSASTPIEIMNETLEYIEREKRRVAIPTG